MRFSHTPVLLQQAVHALNIQPGAKYIDATLGGGGHTDAILKSGGLVLGIDQDEEALDFVKEKFAGQIAKNQLQVRYGNFRNIKSIAEENIYTNVNGILFDLGVSSHQLDAQDRGFSIKHDAPLDMRMDMQTQVTARDVVNTYTDSELQNIFERFGEDIHARDVAEAIIEARHEKKIETTGELVSVIHAAIPRREKIPGKDPATKIFQALRIEVNQELENLKMALRDGFSLLGIDGVLAVISFHSLEDRIVKRQFEDLATRELAQLDTKKPITPDSAEVYENKRSRSAKLRFIKKIK